MQTTQAQPTSWTIQEALTVAFKAFTQRFGADLLPKAFEALTLRNAQTMQAHRALDRDMGKYISSVLDARGEGLTEWLINARADRTQDAMLLDIGVRWWLARDALVCKPPGTLVPRSYAPGSTNHHSAPDLLLQMLHRGSAPDTTPTPAPPVRRGQV